MRAPEQTFSYHYPHPAVTTDVVVFTIRVQRLHLLLIQRANPPFRGQLALPGGFLDIDEDIDTCAARELAEETGLNDLFLEQLYTFGEPGRDPRERVISVAYYALASSERIPEPVASSDAAAVAWFPFEELPRTAFDHAAIIAKAHELLVAKLDTDASPQVSASVGIRGIPTLILYRRGSEVARQTGAVPRSTLDQMLDAT